MELKEIILQTLKELDDKISEDGAKPTLEPTFKRELKPSSEREFLLYSKERFEVLFSGLSSDENRKVEAKLNLVINFLQFYLTKIDERLENLDE